MIYPPSGSSDRENIDHARPHGTINPYYVRLNALLPDIPSQTTHQPFTTPNLTCCLGWHGSISLGRNCRRMSTVVLSFTDNHHAVSFRITILLQTAGVRTHAIITNARCDTLGEISHFTWERIVIVLTSYMIMCKYFCLCKLDNYY